MVSSCSQSLALVEDSMEQVELMRNRIDPLGIRKMSF